MGGDIDLTFAVDRLFPAVVAIMCLVVVPTTAATLDGDLVDALGQETNVVLEPYDGPNGERYVEIQDQSKELTVNVTEQGVNPNAVTTFDRLFNVTNTGDDPREVWVTDSVSDESAVRVYTDGGATTIDTKASRVQLASDETLTAGVRIDTRGSEITAAETLQFTIIVHVRFLADADDDGVPDRSDECVDQPEDVDGVEDDDGCPETNQFGTDDTTVTFPDSIHNETAEAASVTDLDPVDSSISARIVDSNTTGNDRQVRQRAGLDADEYATVNGSTLLDARPTVSSDLAGVEDRHMVKQVEVDVPAKLADESATMTMDVSRSDLGDADPANVSVARRVDGEWTLLDTSVASTTPSMVTFEAETPGFSRFAVLAPNDADHEWRVEGDLQRYDDDRLTYDFESEGIYEVTLTATDDFGNSDTATTRVFVNEPPAASIDVVSNAGGTTATLDAAVVGELGGATVTWQFPDGTTATGERVTHSFDDPTPTVELTVSDEFGLSTTTSTTLSFDSGGTDGTETPSSPGGAPPSDDPETPSSGGDPSTPAGTDEPITVIEDDGVELEVPEDEGNPDDEIAVQELEPVGPDRGDNESNDDPLAVIRARQSGNATGTLEGDIAVDSGGDDNVSGVLEGEVSAADQGEALDADIRSEIQSDPQLDAGIRRPTTDEVQRRLEKRNVNLLTEIHRETNLVGTHSLFASKESIENDKRMVRHVSISVPEEMENRETTIRLDVPVDDIGETDSESLTVAHHTEDGWQVLSTEVVDRSNGTLTVEATTPGFSRFAVFADNSVDFTWDIESFDRNFEDKEISPTFQKPGIYNVTLTVEDAFGLTDTTDYRLLANDPPEVSITQRSIDRQNRTATFAAAVEDQVGNVTVTWVFPDGRTETGRRVTHEFAGENTTVQVYAADEYGALGRTSTTVTFQESLVSFESGIPIQLRHVLASWVIGLVAILLRWRLVWFVGGLFVDHGPEISSVGAPTLERDRVVVDHLRIDDDLGDLTDVSLVVLTDAGEERARTHIECDRTERYERTEQVVWAEGIDGARETYVLRVEAVDDDGNEASAQRPVERPRTAA